MSHKRPDPATKRPQVEFADDFTIQYYEDYKVVTNYYTTPPYSMVLYPCGKDQPAASNFRELERKSSGVAYLPIPLSAVATSDSTVSWAMVRLRACSAD